MTIFNERKTRGIDSLEVIRPFVERAETQHGVQIMGGLGATALAHPEVQINREFKEVQVPEDFSLPTLRPDGTLRDVDVLVLSSSKNRIDEVEKVLKDTIGNTLERSVFGIRPHSILEDQIAKPLGARAFRTFVSDRYEAASNSKEVYKKALFPFQVPMSAESLDTWTLVIGNDEKRIPISHPGATIANYTNRSIGGVRPKDIDKLTAITTNVFTRTPELKSWLADGAGKSQLELSLLLASLRSTSYDIRHVLPGITVPRFNSDELIDHEAFMAPEAPYATQRKILATAAFKAGSLHALESNGIVLKLWRQFAEQRATAIVKNT